MGSGKRRDAVADGFGSFARAARGSQALRNNGLHHRQQVFEAMVQLGQQELLKLPSDFALLGIKSRLPKQGAEPGILAFEVVFLVAHA